MVSSPPEISAKEIVWKEWVVHSVVGLTMYMDLLSREQCSCVDIGMKDHGLMYSESTQNLHVCMLPKYMFHD